MHTLKEPVVPSCFACTRKGGGSKRLIPLTNQTATGRRMQRYTRYLKLVKELTGKEPAFKSKT